MRFGLMIEGQQGLSYAHQLAIARRAEAAGFEAFYRSDHFNSFPGPDALFQDYLPRDLEMVDLLGREFAARALA